MRVQSVDILGKKYHLQLDLKSSELEKISKDINKRLKLLLLEYTDFDKIDIMVFYLVELHEKMYYMDKQLQKEKERLDRISKKILSIENKIKNEIENLT